MDLISAGIIFLVFIVLVVFTWLSAKTWHWVNVLFINLCFLAAVGASIGLAQVYSFRQRDITELERSRAQYERTREEAEMVISGPRDSSTYGPDSLRHKAHQIQLLFLGRGQVWANGNITIDEEKRRFRLATPRAADDPTKLTDVEFHLFADETIRDQPYPVNYIGRVVVVAETPEELVLEPVKAGDFAIIIDRQEWDRPTTSWTLFEQMPLDRRDTFRKLIQMEVSKADDPTEEERQLAEAIAADEEAMGGQRKMEIGPYRRLLEQRYLRPEALNMAPDSLEYEQLIDRYAFDGFSLGRIKDWMEANAQNRISQSFDPPSDEIFVRYRFNKNSTSEYEVDSRTGSIQTDGAFTVTGLAVDPSLHQGRAIRFEAGAEVLIDKPTAEGERGQEQIRRFDAEEEVIKLEEIYVRKLRNFPYLFTNINIRSNEMEKDIQRVQAGIAIQTVAYENAEKQRAERDAVIAGLKQDRDNLQLDLQTAQALLETREQQIQILVAETTDLKQRIRDLHQTIQERNRSIEQTLAAGQ
jgi:hypothetical protein